MKLFNGVGGRRMFWYSAAAFLMAAGRAGSLKFYEATRVALSNRIEFALFIIRLVLYFVVFLGIFVGLDRFLAKRKAVSVFFESGEKVTGKPWTPYLVLAAGWFPLLLIEYPAGVCWDTLVMVEQYRFGSLSEHHSVYYSLIMGVLNDLFESLGHINWGMFTFSFIHYAVLVAAMGWSVNILRKMKVSRAVRWVVLFIYLVNPYNSGYIGVIIKDVPYAAFIMIFFLCLVELYLDHEAFAKSPLKLAILFISVINVWLIRKNGSYIMIASAVLFTVRCIRRKLSKRPVAVLIAALIASAALYGFLGACFHAEKGSVKEALSLPFQQTARYVKVYGDEVTEEERAAIDAVLPYDELAGAYDPRIADPVKGMYKEENAKLPAYFKVWFAQFLKHPFCYVSATWEQNYYLFVPEEDNIAFYRELKPEKSGDRFKSLTGLFKPVDKLTSIKEWSNKEFRFLHQVPAVRLLGNVSFWFYVLLFATAISIALGADNFLLLALSWFSVVFVILGPVIMGHPRYMFPVIYVMPVTVLFIFKKIFESESLKERDGK